VGTCWGWLQRYFESHWSIGPSGSAWGSRMMNCSIGSAARN